MEHQRPRLHEVQRC